MGFLDAIRSALPDDGFFVEELTQVGYVARIAFPTYRPRTYVSTGYQGTLGFGFATALGVKAANPSRAVVSISGDGGFLYTASELATAVLHGIAVVAVVFNDNAYGNVRRMQEAEHGGRVIASALRNPDFVQFGQSFGAHAERVATPVALKAALTRALGRSIPSLIEVSVASLPDPWKFIRLKPARRPAAGPSSISVSTDP
jgi:acetolactate synthase-1/2/3 large subunit